MRFFSPLLIFAALLAAACGGAAVFPEVFSQERADGKIPVSIELIKKQTRKEIDGMPEKQATAERWREIEADYNACRLSSARKTKAEADKVFADCMSRKGYVYMLRLDAEQLHDEIAAEEPAKYAAEKKAAEEARLAAEKQRKKEQAIAERWRRIDQAAAERKAEQDKKDSNLRSWARDGNASEVRAWLAEGANPNAVRNDGATALVQAAGMGHAEVAKILIANGANPNAATDSGFTALMLAIDNGHAEVAKALLAADANPNAAKNDGWTALMYATDKGRPEIVKTLIAAGANPNAKSKSSETALMYASSENRSEIVKVLLDAGAYPDIAADDGATALLHAAQDGYTEIVKMLLIAGANTSKKNKRGETALEKAAFFGHFESTKALLAAGANPNTSDRNRYTALMSSGQEGKYDIVQLLLECGASTNKKNKYGQSVWGLAKDDPILYSILTQHQSAILAGQRISSCKGRWSLYVEPSISGSVATAPPPSGTSGAEAVFKNVWRSIVVIRQGEGQGSGVIVRPNMVATNCHVIDGYGDIVVYKHDNRRASTDTLYNATVRKRDESRDFCLLYVAGLRGVSVKLRKYRTLKVGEDVYAVGSPKGLDLSLSSGIISQLRQGGGERYIQTDAAVSPGSSGGGLFDSDSNLIGILTSKIADEEVEGIGFAIPADLAINL